MPQCRHNHGSCDVEQTAKAKNYYGFSVTISKFSQNIRNITYTYIDENKMVLIIRDVET
jgi:hypothetical protein